MPGETLLILGDPAARYLAALDALPGGTRILAGTTAEALLPGASEARAALVTGAHRELLRELWPRLGRLEWVHSLWAGLEGMLFQELAASPVVLTNGRGVFARSLAEFAIAGMLHFAKDLPRMKRQQAAAEWKTFQVEELYGKVLGIVGYGSIGRATAQLAQAFGMRIHALRRDAGKNAADPHPERTYAPAELNELLAASDYILVAAPLTAETSGLIGAEAFAAMRSSAVLINLGRGPIVVEEHLIDALRSGRLRGAVLDVFDTEPLPAPHPLWGLDKVLLSPHTADHTATWLQEAMQFFLANFTRFCAGQPLLNVTDKRAGY